MQENDIKINWNSKKNIFRMTYIVLFIYITIFFSTIASAIITEALIGAQDASIAFIIGAIVFFFIIIWPILLVRNFVASKAKFIFRKHEYIYKYRSVDKAIYFIWYLIPIMPTLAAINIALDTMKWRSGWENAVYIVVAISLHLESLILFYLSSDGNNRASTSPGDTIPN